MSGKRKQGKSKKTEVPKNQQPLTRYLQISTYTKMIKDLTMERISTEKKGRKLRLKKQR